MQPRVQEIKCCSIEEYESAFSAYKTKVRAPTSVGFRSYDLLMRGNSRFGFRSVKQDIIESGFIPKKETIVSYLLTPWPASYCGQTVVSGMAYLVSGNEYTAQVPANTVSMPVSINDASLEKYFPDEYDAFKANSATGKGAAVISVGALNHLVYSASLLFSRVLKNQFVSKQMLSDLTDTILTTTVDTVVSKDYSRKRVNNNRRWVISALEAIHEQPHINFNVTSLAEFCGISVRSLQQSFKDTLCMSPKEYLSRVRMSRIRIQLLESNNQGIADVAAKYGVVHLGNFSKDYNQMFGEKPSDTLKRKAKAFY